MLSTDEPESTLVEEHFGISRSRQTSQSSESDCVKQKPEELVLQLQSSGLDDQLVCSQNATLNLRDSPKVLNLHRSVSEEQLLPMQKSDAHSKSKEFQRSFSEVVPHQQSEAKPSQQNNLPTSK